MARRGPALALLAGLVVVGGVVVAGTRVAAHPSTPGTPGAVAPGSAAPIGDRAAPSATFSLSPATPLTTSPAPGALEPAPVSPVATDAPLPTTGGGVTVTVTYSGWADAAVEVGGYVAGVLEQGGTCTLTLTQGSATVTRQQPAHADARTTQCGTLSVPGTQLTPGQWRAVLSYRSASSHGDSAPVSVTVPGR